MMSKTNRKWVWFSLHYPALLCVVVVLGALVFLGYNVVLTASPYTIKQWKSSGRVFLVAAPVGICFGYVVGYLILRRQSKK